ncbi:fatty acyl-CoA reductase 1-like [Athalia rosae]|uniref:fatty acyl-CoA reductase 1-like n=1 Tax=Athalia rosae TaxID=37344 RepID=UPI002033CC32|nr:fatty acyl-CoA reductase 1-like [Athalia rosae]
MAEEGEVAKWYRNKVIFVTGATGFMGKVLVEKLLRSFEDLGPIYVLVRPKRSVRVEERIEKMADSRAFEELRGARANRENWILPIAGDAGLPGLGISAEDRILLQEKVSVVFHLAATVRFDEPLRNAVAMNVRGTRELLRLCQGMKNLRSFVHVSTAYANCDRPIIEERFYSPPLDLTDLEDRLANIDDDLLGPLTPSLIGKHPNTYTFTKALAEHVVAEYSARLPVVVVRPSIVSPSWKEPKPGWVDAFNGPTVLAVGSGKGLLGSVYGRGDFVADLVPVDVCINLLIVAAWDTGAKFDSKPERNVRVYNCVSRPFNPVTWNDVAVVYDECTRKYAMSGTFMCPKVGITDSKVKHALIKMFCQTVPGTVVDFLTMISGGRPSIRHYQRQLEKASTVLEFFTTNEWEFEAKNAERLRRRMNPADLKTFDFNLADLDWAEYIDNGFLGIRRYLLKEEDDTIQAARENIVKWALIKKTVRIFFVTCTIAISVIGLFTVYFNRPHFFG